MNNYWNPEYPIINPAIINSQFAPANFDGDDTNQPLAAVFDTGGSGNSTPYTTTANKIMAIKIDETRGKTLSEFSETISWRRRLRDFLSRKNTDLLDFLNVSVKSHPTLGRGDAILRKFGNKNLISTSALVKDVLPDISGSDIFSEIKLALSEFRTENSVSDFKATITYIYEEYRKTGDNILTLEGVMKMKLDIFDKIQKTIVSLLELEPTEASTELMKTSEKYLENIFIKHNIQFVYEELLKAYKYFMVLREFVEMLRIVQSNENEPLCPICLDRPVSHCINPCGHTLCQQCLKRQANNCFMCRERVETTIRLYFG